MSNHFLTTGFNYPYIDGDIIPKTSYEILMNDEYLHIPLLIGTNTDEGSLFVMNYDLNTTKEFEEFIHIGLPSLTMKSILELNKLYPMNDSKVSVPLDPSFNTSEIVYPMELGSQYPRLATLFGDVSFIAGTRLMSKLYSEKNIPVYKYRFNIQDAGMVSMPFVGAAHAQELVYVFDNNDAIINTFDVSASFNPDPKSSNISKIMSSMWANFITNLSPNIEISDDDDDILPKDVEIPNWPEYLDGEENMVFDLEYGLYLEQDDWRKEQIGFLESIMPELNA